MYLFCSTFVLRTVMCVTGMLLFDLFLLEFNAGVWEGFRVIRNILSNILGVRA